MSTKPFYPDSKLNDYLNGSAAIIPLTLGAIPFGVIYGAIASSINLSLIETTAMSALVFAGSAQFVALGMLAADSALSMIIITAIIVNLRHALYSAWLAPQLASLTLKWKSILAFGLTDEVFAIVSQHYKNNGVGNRWFFLGAASFLWLFWTLSSLFGYIAGTRFPELNQLGLEIAMPITFGSIVLLTIKDKASYVATIVACISAYLSKDLPHQLGLIVATLLGIGSGYLASQSGRLKEGDND